MGGVLLLKASYVVENVSVKQGPRRIELSSTALSNINLCFARFWGQCTEILILGLWTMDRWTMDDGLHNRNITRDESVGC